MQYINCYSKAVPIIKLFNSSSRQFCKKMGETPPLLLRILASSASIVNRAGDIIKDVMKKGELGIVSKGKNDLQTEADRSAQNCIVASLSKQFPGLTVIGEEGENFADVPSDWLVDTFATDVMEAGKVASVPSANLEDVVVWVDPLDGTSEYTEGLLHHVTVLIGIAVKGEAVGGIIHQPYYSEGGKLGRTIWGLKQLGVGGFVPTAPPTDKFIITTTRSHSNELVESTLQSLKPDDVIRVGGAGYKVVLLLEGKAHAYVFASPGAKKWDTCAPEAVLKCAGGCLTDLHGTSYSYAKDVSFPNATGVLAAATFEQHQRCLAVIKSNKVFA